MDAVLVMFKADGQRREFPLSKAVTVLGRKHNCDLRVPISSVSREHCQIELADDDAILLRDLGSSNGTFCNDQRVQEARLAAGDRITVGPVHFTLVIDGVPAEIQQVPTLLPNDGEVESNIPERPAASVPRAAAAPRPVHAIDDDDEPVEALLPVDDDDDDDLPVTMLDEEDDAAPAPKAPVVSRPDTPHDAAEPHEQADPVAMEALVADDEPATEAPAAEELAEDDPLAALAALAAGAEEGGDDLLAELAGGEDDDEVTLLGLDDEDEDK